MKSMTGHGRGESRSPSWAAVVECHSVNRKTLEVVVHGDRSIQTPDAQMREAVHQRFSRGRVQINVALQRLSAFQGPRINRQEAEAFAREARALKGFLNLAGELTLAEVLAAPGVCTAADDGGEEITELVLKALEAALDGLEAARATEGGALKGILQAQAAGLHSILGKIEGHATGIVSSHRENLLRRVTQAGVPLDPDSPRLLAEIALFAERSDITEEIDRGGIHIRQFLQKLDDARPVGRTLEFLVQELGREFNTIASKCQSAAVAALVIDAKAALDRLREQIANIE